MGGKLYVSLIVKKTYLTKLSLNVKFILCFLPYAEDKLTLWRAFNLTAFIHSSTGPVAHLFASCQEGLGFNSKEGTYVKPGFSC
jgi:hypothetical protein